MSAIPIGRLAGFEIRIHVSWAIILAIIVVTSAPRSARRSRLVDGRPVGDRGAWSRSCSSRRRWPTSLGTRRSPASGRPDRLGRRVLLRRRGIARAHDDPSARRGRHRRRRSARQPGHRPGACWGLGGRGNRSTTGSGPVDRRSRRVRRGPLDLAPRGCSTCCRRSRSTADAWSAAWPGRGPAIAGRAADRGARGPVRRAVPRRARGRRDPAGRRTGRGSDRRADGRVVRLVPRLDRAGRRARGPGSTSCSTASASRDVMDRDVAGDPAGPDARHVRRAGPRRQSRRWRCPSCGAANCSACIGARAGPARPRDRDGPRPVPRT